MWPRMENEWCNLFHSQDLQMMDGLRQRVCVCVWYILLPSAPLTSEWVVITLNSHAQHVMMGRALPNSACRGPTAAMEAPERVGQGQEVASLTSLRQLLVCFPLCCWPVWINRATSTQHHALACIPHRWPARRWNGNQLHCQGIWYTWWTYQMIPSPAVTGMVQLRVDWVVPDWSVSSHRKGLRVQELHRVPHLCNTWLLFVLRSTKADGSSRTAASWNSSGASSHG